jgi:hypothetical protein
MRYAQLKHCLLLSASLLAASTDAHAQIVEAVGSRALGMGGAFVAVADDSSATWWNPAGLATGPFLDLALARADTEQRGEPAARRDAATWFALATPPFGFSYYRLKVEGIQGLDPNVTESGNREDRRTGGPVRTLDTSQYGITLVQTLVPGVHAGATLKYVRGRVDGGDTDGTFDVDVGVIGVAGPVRLGLLVRNAREPEFGGGPSPVRLDRQVRIGGAYDARARGGPPVMVAADVDLQRVETVSGDRRNVAAGAEAWLFDARLALRGGARFNTAGARQRAATAGVSVAVRAGLWLDGHVVRGGADDDRGWGVAARVSF